MGAVLGLLFLVLALPARGVLLLNLRLLRRQPRAGARLALAIGLGVGVLGGLAGTQIVEWLYAVPLGLMVSGLSAWALRAPPSPQQLD